MAFLSNLISGTIKIATSPVSIVKDIAETIITSEPGDNTKNHIQSGIDDISDAFEDIFE